MIPFFAFALGAGLNLAQGLAGRPARARLGVAVVVVTGIPLFFADRATGGTGVAGVAAASTAGNAAAVPAIVAAANPAYADVGGLRRRCWSPPAVVVTSILVPIVTAWTASRVRRRGRRCGASDPAEPAERPDGSTDMGGRLAHPGRRSDRRSRLRDRLRAGAACRPVGRCAWGECAGASGERPAVLSYDAAAVGCSADAAAAAAPRRHPGAPVTSPDAALQEDRQTCAGSPRPRSAALPGGTVQGGASAGLRGPGAGLPGDRPHDDRRRGHVDGGRPLEEAEVWRREHTYPSADLVEVLASAGLRRREVLTLATSVAAGSLKAAFASWPARLTSSPSAMPRPRRSPPDRGGEPAALALDLLHRQRRFGACPGRRRWRGATWANPSRRSEGPSVHGGTLVVVGIAGRGSRRPRGRTRRRGTVRACRRSRPHALLDGATRSGSAVATDVNGGSKRRATMLVEIAVGRPVPTWGSGHSLAQSAGRVFSRPVAAGSRRPGGDGRRDRRGAADALRRQRASVSSTRSNPACRLGLTAGRLSFPIVTKAGAFGDEDSLIRIVERLRAIRTKGTTP